MFIPKSPAYYSIEIYTSMIEYPTYSPNFTLFTAISIHSTLCLTALIDHYTSYSLINFTN